MKFRKRPIVIEATQWFRNGDHPDDLVPKVDSGETEIEGKVVRRWRRPDIRGEHPCGICGRLMHAHGWIDTLEAGHRVCPGDWIITGVAGEVYPCKATVFDATYEAVE